MMELFLEYVVAAEERRNLSDSRDEQVENDFTLPDMLSFGGENNNSLEDRGFKIKGEVRV